MKYKIYKLLENNCPIYIGQTTCELISRKYKGWHRLDNERLKKCEMILIEETDDISRERYWITYYLSEGFILLNKQKGDTGLTGENSKKFGRKKWVDENKESIKEYYNKNKDSIKLKNTEWNKNNPDKRKEITKKYRNKNK